jgi:hemerythrin-like domain-containing protein
MNNAPSPSDRPTAVLKAEHQTILRVINVLEVLVRRSEGGAGFEVDALRRCVTFFRLFADACHHAKEEDLLFPAMEARGVPREDGPIGVMLYEHRIARQHTKSMADAIEAFDRDEPEAVAAFRAAAYQYIDLLRNHIFKEDNILFQMSDRVMTNDDQASLCSQFCEVGCRAFEGKTIEALSRIADELESAWLAGGDAATD